MESTELRIFKEVARTQSISKAADHLGYVQSNITAHIKKLETELNTSLMIRHNKGITLTKDGEELLFYAQKIIALLDDAKKALVQHKTLNIGTTQTIAGYFLPKYLMEYQKLYPDIRISVRVDKYSDMVNQLINRELDCIVINSLNDITNVDEILRIPEELYLITPKECESIEDIKEYSLLVNHRESCPYRKILQTYILSKGYQNLQMIELDSVEAIKNAVSLGMGISLLPDHTIQEKENINKFQLNEIQATAIRFLIPHHSSCREVISFQSCIENSISGD